MSDSLLAPTPTYANSLAPPQDPSRPASASSNRSSTSSRRGRSGRGGGGSSDASRSHSHSSRGSEKGDKKKQSGATTTISGGTSLGATSNTLTSGSSGKKIKNKKNGAAGGNSGANTPTGTSGEEAKGRKASKSRPNPINTSAPRPSSQNSGTKAASASDAAAPISIHAAPSVPKTALAAAVDAANEKRKESTGNDALSSLQKMISDIKAIPPSSSSSSSSHPGSRSASGTKELSVDSAKEGSNPVSIPGSAASSKKLKADAPTFTPSFASSSPVTSQAGVSPVGNAPTLGSRQPRSASNASRRRTSSSSHLDPFQGMSPVGGYNTLPQFGAFATGGDDAPFTTLQDQQYQQQLMAAQQLQYQQIQLLQAQLAATQMIQQQQQLAHPQHQSAGGFSAPRFQALAAQRAAQQQAQQAQQLAQAQQLFEIQQQQLLEYERRQEETRARAAAQATLRNPLPVFEEDDSPETRSAPLGPTGRPQLAPSFTFGKKARTESVSEEPPADSSPSAPVINRSEGIGGAAATGLAGLAARAHKRTGSELTPAMQQQVSQDQLAVFR